MYDLQNVEYIHALVLFISNAVWRGVYWLLALFQNSICWISSEMRLV